MESAMTMFSIGIIIAAGLVMSALIFALATSGRFTRVTGLIGRSFWCPYVARRVTAELREDMKTGQALDVSWCTAFVPAVAMRCGKPCLRQPGFMQPRGRPRRGWDRTLSRRAQQEAHQQAR
jgi:hypothetical protein